MPSPVLTGHAATFLPSDPPRHGRLALWHPDPVPDPEGFRFLTSTGHTEDVPLVLAGEDGEVHRTTRPAALLTVADALPALLRRPEGGNPEDGGSPEDSEAVAFWRAAARFALRLAARGLLLPGVSAADHDTWRMAPLDHDDVRELRDLAAAMPPHAHAASVVAAPRPPRLPAPEALLRDFLDAVADSLPRTPAAPHAAGGPAYAADGAQHVPHLRPWAEEAGAGRDGGVRLSLRVEATGLQEAGAPADTPADPGAVRFRAVLQAHDPGEPAVVRDAAEVWSGAGGARADALLALRRAARVWPPLGALLSTAVPEALELSEEEAGELLGARVLTGLQAAGLAVHWPRDLVGRLSTHAVVGPDTEHPRRGPAHGLLSPHALADLSWRFALEGEEMTRAELDALAESGRPLVRLRERWVLVDPEALRAAGARRDARLSAPQALAAALTGSLPEGGDGGEAPVRASGWVEELRARLADTGAAPGALAPVPQPAALAATLRDYQLRGLDWLHRLTSLGLGGCLADDMGLGKTVTLIALHLHRRGDPALAGPTLVVCPASLLGNWEREVRRFAPGVAVRRFHGPRRDLDGLPADAFVLTTYGTMRRDAARLVPPGADGWGLVVADEAQHAKNPASGTARALRTLPARARVALTGTPVENDLSELWAVLDWTTPGLLGTLGAFRRRYADAAEAGDPQAAARLAALVRPFLLRRRKSDPGIAPELPPKTETDHAVGLTAEQAGLYEAVVREALAALAGTSGMARRGLVLKLLTSLKQVCNHPAQYLKEDDPVLTGRSGKLELLDELLGTALAEGASVLVFTQYVAMARLLERHLAERGVGAQLLHGGTPVARREEMVRRFEAGEVPVFLLSLKAAGTGLNLTRAEHVVHVDRWWNPAVEAQATDRAYRIGQTRPVQVHRLAAEGTVEDRIAALLESKKALADAVLGSGEAALTELSDAELAALVALEDVA